MNSIIVCSIISSLITMPLAFVLIFLLTYEWKYNLRRMLRTATLYLLLMTFIKLIIFAVSGVSPFSKFLASVADLLGCMLFNYLFARSRNIQLLFTYSNSCVFIFISDTVTGILVPAPGPLHILVKLLIFGTAALIVYYIFRPPFMEIVTRIPERSRWYTLFPTFLCLFLFYFIRGNMLIDLYPNLRPVLLFLCFCAVCAYVFYFVAFSAVHRQFTAEADKNVLAAQIESYRKQLAISRESSERMALFRHDLRHFYQLQSGLLKNNDSEGALKALQTIFHDLDGSPETTSVIRSYTGHDALDSVISFYRNRMEEKNTELTVRLQITEIPGDEMEFAVVLCNALENALNACQKQPEGEKRSVRLLSSESIGRVFLEVTNTCIGDIHFDKSGLPQGTTKGHGYGIKSISYFVRKNGGQMKCFVRDGWFHLQLVLLAS